MKIKIAVVGAGNHANAVHYPSLASFKDVEIIANCDLNSQKLNSTANKYSIKKRYSNYRKMIEETSPDGIYLIGPPHEMYDAWIWCLEKGLNICIEKPMGITLHQAKILNYLSKKNGSITQVSFQRRSCPLLKKLKDKCLKNGPISHAVCKFYKNSLYPFLQAKDHMMDDGVHSIDTLRWICGGEIKNIKSVNKNLNVPDINLITAILEFDNGSLGILINNWTSGRRLFEVEIHSPGICVEVNPEDKGVLYKDNDITGKIYDTKIVSDGNELYEYGGFKSKNREFIDAIINNTNPESSFNDSLKTMEIAEKILHN